jgi:hypothetical protein
MRTVVFTNPFNNRNPNGNENTSSDPNNRNHYTLADGFLQNDTVYVPDGFEVKLTLQVINNDVLLNQTGIDHANSICNDYQAGNFGQTTTYASTLLTRTVKCPIFILLKNLSIGQTFVTGTTITFNLYVELVAYAENLDQNAINTILQATAQIMGLNFENLQFLNNVIIPRSIELLSTELGMSDPSTEIRGLSNIYQLSKRISALFNNTRDIPTWDVTTEMLVTINLDEIQTNQTTIEGVFQYYINRLNTAYANGNFTEVLRSIATINSAYALLNSTILSVYANNLQEYTNTPSQGPPGPPGPAGPKGVAGVFSTDQGNAVVYNTQVLIGKTTTENPVTTVLDISGNVSMTDSITVSGDFTTENMYLPLGGSTEVYGNMFTGQFNVGIPNEQAEYLFDISGDAKFNSLFVSKYQTNIVYSLVGVSYDTITVRYTDGSVYYVDMAAIPVLNTSPFKCIVNDLITTVGTPNTNIALTLILDYRNVVNPNARYYCNTLYLTNTDTTLESYFSGGEPVITSTTEYLIQDFKILYRNGIYRHSVCSISMISS